jgi:hypothetical protein
MIYNETAIGIKHIVQASATATQIERYSDKVRKGQNPCGLGQCPRCRVKAAAFTRHEKRKRRFLIAVEQIVKAIRGLLCRWKCPGCGKTFTDYPDFALPYKRYTLPTMMGFSGCYLDYESISYRKLVQEIPLGYENLPNGHIDERQLAHSTTHRWITTMGNFPEIIRRGQALIDQADPTSTICRDLSSLNVYPQKYQETARKKVLQRCRQILHLEAAYRLCFKTSIFPKLATACSFT